MFAPLISAKRWCLVFWHRQRDGCTVDGGVAAIWTALSSTSGGTEEAAAAAAAAASSSSSSSAAAAAAAAEVESHFCNLLAQRFYAYPLRQRAL